MLLKPPALAFIACCEIIDLAHWLRFNQGLKQSFMIAGDAKLCDQTAVKNKRKA